MQERRERHSNIKLFARKRKSIVRRIHGNQSMCLGDTERFLARKLVKADKNASKCKYFLGDHAQHIPGGLQTRCCRCSIDSGIMSYRLFSLSFLPVTEFHTVVHANRANLCAIGRSHAWNSIISDETRGGLGWQKLRS